MSSVLVHLQSSRHHTNLLGAMWKLRIMGDLCDITVQVDFHGELKEFEAHWVVLAASSGYFSPQLLTNEQMNKIFLSNITPKAFGKFLEFAYFGKTEVEKQCISDILDMAKQLQCPALVEACVEALSALEEESLDKNVKSLKRKIKRGEKRKKRLKLVERRSELTIRDRRSGRLGGRRVKVNFSFKKSKLAAGHVKKLPGKMPRSVEEEPSQDVPGEKDTVDDSVTSSPAHEDNDDQDDESDFVPELDVEIPDDVQKKTDKFRCEDCSRSFQYEKSFHKHLKLCHGVETETTLRCETCQQVFASRCNLKLHQQHVHSDQRLFPCDVCTKSFKRKKDVMRHQRNVHEGGTDRFICTLCGNSLSSKTALKLHERTHTGVKPYKCDICGSCFSQGSALKTHKRIHSGEKPFACDLCDARFTQNHMLAYHKRSHTGEKPFMCENCGKSFASKEYLKHHSRIHSGSKPYKCETCERAFAQRNSLHQHMKIHTGERPYHCDKCDKQFTQLNALQRHQRIHTGEKPYMCSMCRRTFSDKSTLRRHTLTHDKEAPWKNYLVVLEGNVEERAEKPSSKRKQESSSADATEPLKPQEELPISTQPVTISENWAGTGTGTIALVSHSALGGLTVIQTEVPAGTQLQPLVTTDGTNVISLDASGIGVPVTVPFSIPISVAHSVTVSPGALPISVSSTPASGAGDVECEAVAVEETHCTESQPEHAPSAEALHEIEVFIEETA